MPPKSRSFTECDSSLESLMTAAFTLIFPWERDVKKLYK